MESMVVENVPVTNIEVDESLNLRKDYGELESLAQSIRAYGIRTPVTVIPQDGAKPYKLVVGFRRVKSALTLGMGAVPARILSNATSEKEAVMENYVENVQRLNLNPMEEAEGLKTLLDSGWNKNEILAHLGWSKALFTVREKMLAHSDDIQWALRESRISVLQAAQISRLPEDMHSKWIDKAESMMFSDLKKKIEKIVNPPEPTEELEPDPEPEQQEQEDVPDVEPIQDEFYKAAKKRVAETLTSLASRVHVKKADEIKLPSTDVESLETLGEILERTENELSEAKLIITEQEQEIANLKKGIMEAQNAV